eukprot:Skav229440  [mRNA]  locus=scaffold397:120508:132442:- [translate_table: standard]
MVAARGGHAAVVRALLVAKADITARSEDGSDALLHAASGGDVDVIKALLEAKSDIESVNEDEVSPLLLAAHYGHANAAKVLLAAGANSEYRVPGWESVDCQKLLSTLKVKNSRPKASEHFSYESGQDGQLKDVEEHAVLLDLSSQLPLKQLRAFAASTCSLSSECPTYSLVVWEMPGRSPWCRMPLVRVKLRQVLDLRN